MKIRFPLLIIVCYLFANSVKGQFEVEASNSITVIRSGGSVIQNPWTGGMNSVQFSKFDADYDGQEDDIYIFDRQGNRSLVFIGDPVGSEIDYTYDPSYRNSFPLMNNYALLRDFDCDGNRDIFTYSPIGGAVSIHKNTGSESGLSWELETEALLSFFDFGASEFTTNIYTSSQDIPAIFDYEGDGDLDILSFNVGGSFIELHLNNSIENTGVCGLDYFLANRCYGGFIEGDEDNTINTNPDDVEDVCGFNVENPRAKSKNLRHVGSTILTLDGNNDGLHDLVLGDVGFDNLIYLENSDQGSNPDQIVSFDDQFPSSIGDGAVSIDNFPAAFYEDVNGDDIPDLIVGVNSTIGASSLNSIHLYINNGNENSPQFQFETTSFLQENTLDWGRNSCPVFFDFNEDGLVDIIIGCSVENPEDFGTIPRLIRLENIGSVNSPSFQIVDEDWLGISDILPSTDPVPVFGDFDQDGDEDLVVGLLDGSVHFFLNENGLSYQGVLDLNGGESLISFSANPEAADLNNDGFPDLLIGEGEGNINYFENSGISGLVEFSISNENLGGINTTQTPPFFEGRSAPNYFELEDEEYLAVGSKSGKLFVYTLNETNLEWTELAEGLNIYNSFDTSPIGLNTKPAIRDLNNDGIPEVVTGLSTGGIELFEGTSLLSDHEALSSFSNFSLVVYPNPSDGILRLDLTHKDVAMRTLRIFSIEGKLILESEEVLEEYDLKGLEAGLYLIQVETALGLATARWIKN